MKLTVAQLDRAAGVLLGQACGDALGVPYEFGPPMTVADEPEMRGGGLGPYAPGEWSDDTQMAICIARVAATGADLGSADSLDDIAQGFLDWRANGASDIGNQTRSVLSATGSGDSGSVGERMRAASLALHARTGHTAGNGALMRTGIVGLGRLGDATATADTARTIATLTHADPLAGDSCVIWSLAIRHAVLHGTFDGVRDALVHIPIERLDDWARWLDEAEQGRPSLFLSNGFTVTALQAAWWAITSTAVPSDDPSNNSFPCQHLQEALKNAVRIGGDTDTVAAIAGALLGARWGASAVPGRWRCELNGWPSMFARDLVRLGILTAREGKDDNDGWPTVPKFDYASYGQLYVLEPHPSDPDVLMGAVGHLYDVPDGVDAVVSLCRLGRSEVPAVGVTASKHHEVWLVDSLDRTDNPNLEFVIDDAARTVKQLRTEGRRVLLHCVQAQSRTPTVAARYGALLGVPTRKAIHDVDQSLQARPNATLAQAVHRLGG